MSRGFIRILRIQRIFIAVLAIITALYLVYLIDTLTVNIKNINYVKSITSKEYWICEDLNTTNEDSVLDFIPETFHGPLTILQQVWNFRNIEELYEESSSIQDQSYSLLFPYIYVTCAKQLNSVEKQFILKILEAHNTRNYANYVLNSFGKPNLLNKQDVSDALAFYSTLISAYPDHQIGNVRLASLYSRNGNWDRAIHHSTEVIKVDAEYSRFTLIAYQILLRSLIKENRCLEVEKHLDDINRLAHSDQVESDLRDDFLKLYLSSTNMEPSHTCRKDIY